MKWCFLLSGENPKLALGELKAVLKTFSAGSQLRTNSRIAISDMDLGESEIKKIQKRLALTRLSGEMLFEGRVSKMREKTLNFRWERIYKESFSVRIQELGSIETGISEREVGGLIFEALRASGVNPKVDLQNARTRIEFIISKGRFFCIRIVAEQENDFEERRQGRLPSNYPVGMHPKLSRCMVNLSGAREGSTIYDPFCGTGGILIEAALAGMKAEGSDIDENMLKLCRKNLKYLGINAKTFRMDASKIRKKYDYIVSDLPYGKSSRLSEDKHTLYSKFLKKLYRILKERAVLCINKSDYGLIRRNLNRIRIVCFFDHYIHRSLTKRIIVLER